MMVYKVSNEANVVRIFRVENSLGQGPWTSRKIDIYRIMSKLIEKSLITEDYHPSRHPGPSEDSLLSKAKKLRDRYGYMDNEILKSYIFGFESVQAFLNWFDHPLLREEMSKTFTLNEYRINKRSVVFGSMQLLFKKEYATLIKKHDIRACL